MKKYAKQDRLDYILDVLGHLNHVTLDDLAEKLKVTTQTVRRDVATLEKRNLVMKYHGGILSLVRDNRENYALRQTDQLDAKKVMSHLCLEYIADNSSVFMTIGTTLEILAKNFVNNRTNLTIITNSIKNANILIENSSFNVITPCGNIRSHNGGVAGSEAANFLKSFRMDYVVLSAGSISEDGLILDYNLDEALLARQMIEQSQQVILLMDSMKFHMQANVVLSALSNVDILITDQKPSDSYIEICRNSGCKLIYPNKS